MLGFQQTLEDLPWRKQGPQIQSVSVNVLETLSVLGQNRGVEGREPQ